MLIYDGDCGFCSKAAAWANENLKISVEPWQRAELSALGLTEEECRTAVQWSGVGEPPKAGGAAVAEALQHGPGAWPYLGATMSIPAFAPAIERAYRFVANRRGHLSRLLSNS